MATTAITNEQHEILVAIALVLRGRKRRTGSYDDLAVTTAELSAQTGRAGQVVGLLCGNLVRKGLLKRVAPSRYKPTAGAFEAIV